MHHSLPLTNSLISLLFLLLALSCSECKNNGCEEAALPDMTGLVIPESNEVMAGEEYYFDHNIENVEEEFCELTMDAGISRTTYDVEYKPNDNTPYVLDNQGQGLIDPIPAGGTNFSDYEALFEEPGIYRLIVRADGKEDVTERNEDNNTEVEDASGRSSLQLEEESDAFYVRVLENPDYKSKWKEGMARSKVRLVSSRLEY